MPNPETIQQQIEQRKRRGLTVDEFDKPNKLAYLSGDRLAGKTILIIGGTNGIGQATAILFALQGGSVAINYRDGVKAEYTRKLLESARVDLSRVAFVKADITYPDDIKRMYERTGEEFQTGIDTIGLFAAGGATSDNESDAREINYTAQLNLARIALEQGVFPDTGGVILWVTSEASRLYGSSMQPKNPELAGFARSYEPVVKWKHETGLHLPSLILDMGNPGVRFKTLSGPLIPHTSLIDLIQAADLRRIKQRHLALFPMLVREYRQASRLDMAAGALHLLTDTQYSELTVNQGLSEEVFGRWRENL